MKKQTFFGQEEVAAFFNQKAANGMGIVKALIGSISVTIDTREFLNSLPQNKTITILFLENPNGFIVIKDVF
ncbi:MAG: hypothetical protein KatS3mg035_0996 [Bacteroidia bacterium]|nr:MAG: hypothetical protein KatS3mg035_0996 [Bacteroidia bacterium]